MRNEILVREGKGNKDRVTMLATRVRDRLLKHLERVGRLHARVIFSVIDRLLSYAALAPLALTRVMRGFFTSGETACDAHDVTIVSRSFHRV
jgi:hypothetical protein